jgi:hypothetical protein
MISIPPGAITLNAHTENSSGAVSMFRAVCRTVTRGPPESIEIPSDFKIRPPVSCTESTTTSPVDSTTRCSTGWLSAW